MTSAGDAPAEASAQADVESTGDPRVDTAVARLAEVDGLPTSQHAEVYDEIHRRLQDALADLDGS